MSTQHTPGPWRLAWVPEGVKPIVQRGKEGWFEVCGMSAERERADAHLIVAAPDLLEALQYMLAVCPAINHQGEEAHQQASAAITKATREQT